MEKISIEEEKDYFGPLFPYVKDEEITDIDFNGRELWLTDSRNARRLCEDVKLPEDFVDTFTKRVANTVSRPFHKQSPVLEAETDTLRITIVHESVAISGRSFCIRKSLPKVRLNEETMLREKYCSKEMLSFLKNCVKAKLNLVVCGEPGAGKTECAKFFSRFIPENEKVITIEDTPEWHYSKVKPDSDSIELKVNDNMDYTTAIKTCLRLNPKWMFLSEVRSKEVLHLIEGFSTGVRGITTLHTDDVRKVPDRMVNMAGQQRNEGRLENDIYSFIDVAVLVRRKESREGEKEPVIRRFIDQIGLFYRDRKENCFLMIAEDGEIMSADLPDEYMKRFYEAGIRDPFSYEEQEMTLFPESISLMPEKGYRERLLAEERCLVGGGTYLGERYV